MPHKTTTTCHDEMPRLRELQTKYEAVLAENHQLYQNLRAEQANRERFESVYRQVQEDVQKDQEVLRRLYSQMGPSAVTQQREADSRESVTFSRKHADREASSTHASVAISLGEGNRLHHLERDCAHLQAKVESLKLSLRRYEQNEITQGADSASASAPAHFHLPPAMQADKRDTPSVSFSSTSTEALQAEKEGRRRAEEQLARCHVTLRTLREDAAQKEFFFYQQLNALQEQNAALLEDLDLWVTGEQQMYLANTFTPRQANVVTIERANLSSSPSSPVQLAKVVESDTDRTQGAKELMQMQQYLKDQEGVLVLKDKSIAQLEARVRELEQRLASTEKQQVQPHAPAPSPLSAIQISMKEFLQLQHEAAALEAAVQRYAKRHLPETYVLSTPSLHISTHGENLVNTAADDAVRDIHSVLRCVLRVLSDAPQSPHPNYASCRDFDTVLQEPPFTVVQTASVSSPYKSGETLTEAAQQLATLMRRRV